MYNTERTVDECRIQKVGDNMTTTKTSKISLNTFDDNRFCVYNIKNASLAGDKDLLVNKILELTINDDTKLIEAAIRLYNDL